MLASDGDYLFDAANLKEAILLKDNYLEQVVAELNHLEDLSYFLEIFDRWNQEDRLNFADYLFLRKLNLAWKKCLASFD